MTAVVDGTTRGLLFSQTSFALRGSSVRTKVTPTDRTQNQQSQDYNAGFYVAVHSRGYTTFYRGAHLHSGCSFVVNTHMQPKGGTVWGVYSTAQRARLHRGTEYSGGPQPEGAGSIDPGPGALGTQCLIPGHCPPPVHTAYWLSVTSPLSWGSAHRGHCSPRRLCRFLSERHPTSSLTFLPSPCCSGRNMFWTPSLATKGR